MYENKSGFLHDVADALSKFSREPVEDIIYQKENDTEYAIICYQNGYEKKVNVNADSCVAMMIDIGKAML